MKINKRGFWEIETPDHHAHDDGLIKGLIDFFREVKATSILDAGCGDGAYTKALQDYGFDVVGVDGNPYTYILTGGLCSTLDLSKEVELDIRFDWILSLEVGEHIPAEFEDIFIGNLHRHNRSGMILSWSIPEYGGEGHFNPRPNNYIISKVEALGYTLDEDATEKLRNSPAKYPEPCYWFSKTLMVFRRDK